MLCRYLQHLLRTARLDGLLAKHTEMLSEIKNLDSDMQMLVYENYNRFISATDTVRTMKSNVDGMDSSMQDLEKVTGTLHPSTSTCMHPCRALAPDPFSPAAYLSMPPEPAKGESIQCNCKRLAFVGCS